MDRVTRIMRLMARLQDRCCFAAEREARKRELIAEGAPAGKFLARWAGAENPPNVEAVILDVIGETGDAGTVAFLRRRLRDGRVPVRKQAAHALRRVAERVAAGELERGIYLFWELKRALPLLRRLAEEMPGNPGTFPYRAAIEQIVELVEPVARETRPGGAEDLPIPAQRARPETGQLPVPSAPRVTGRRSLPLEERRRLRMADSRNGSTTPAPGWTSIYSGPIEALRLVEARLSSFGIPYQRLAGQRNITGGATEAHSPLMLEYRLAVLDDVLEARREEIELAIRSSGWDGEGEVDPAAMAEAEEDFDVRACAECLLYLSETFDHCPGCGAALVPAVEVFEEGQAEPNRIIVRTGAAEAVKALSERLEAAGFAAEAFEVDGWSVAAVDLPWGELTDRTREVREILGG